MVRISLFVFLLFSTFSVMGFFFPLYLQHKHLDNTQIGGVIAAGALVSIIAQLFWGSVSDMRKTVKRVLLVLMGSSFLLSIGLFSSDSLFMITLFFLAFSFVNNASGPLAETLSISYAHRNNRNYGAIRLWGEVGVGTSSLLIGAYIGHAGIDRLWFFYAACLLLALAAALPVRDIDAATAPIRLKQLAGLGRNPKLVWFLFLVMLLAVPQRMNDSMLSIYLKSLGASDSAIGLAWLISTFSTVPALFIAGKWIHKWNPLVVLIAASAAYTLRWLLYGIASGPEVLLAAQAFHGLTFGLLLVAAVHYIAGLVPEEMRASGQSSFAVVFGGVSGIIGSAGGGYLMDLFGPSAVYLGGSLLSAAGAGAILSTYRWNRRRAALGAIKERGSSI